MDISDLLRDEVVTAWITYDTEIRIKVKFLTEDVLWELTDRAGKNNRRKLLMLICQECVMDWSGFSDGEDPLPCTKENITKLAEKLTAFSSFVETAATEYMFLKRYRLLEEKKSSGRGSEPGSSIRPSTANNAGISNGSTESDRLAKSLRDQETPSLVSRFVGFLKSVLSEHGS